MEKLESEAMPHLSRLLSEPTMSVRPDQLGFPKRTLAAFCNIRIKVFPSRWSPSRRNLGNAGRL
jgi:hypothetical protein